MGRGVGPRGAGTQVSEQAYQVGDVPVVSGQQEASLALEVTRALPHVRIAAGAVDIGGTFTDCFFVWGEHHNLALGRNEALEQACRRAGLDRGRCCPRWTSSATRPRWAPTR